MFLFSLEYWGCVFCILGGVNWRGVSPLLAARASEWRHSSGYRVSFFLFFFMFLEVLCRMFSAVEAGTNDCCVAALGFCCCIVFVSRGELFLERFFSPNGGQTPTIEHPPSHLCPTETP